MRLLRIGTVFAALAIASLLPAGSTSARPPARAGVLYDGDCGCSTVRLCYERRETRRRRYPTTLPAPELPTRCLHYGQRPPDYPTFGYPEGYPPGFPKLREEALFPGWPVARLPKASWSRFSLRALADYKKRYVAAGGTPPGRSSTGAPTWDGWVVWHVLPRELGGTSGDDNLIPVPRSMEQRLTQWWHRARLDADLDDELPASGSAASGGKVDVRRSEFVVPLGYSPTGRERSGAGLCEAQSFPPIERPAIDPLPDDRLGDASRALRAEAEKLAQALQPCLRDPRGVANGVLAVMVVRSADGSRSLAISGESGNNREGEQAGVLPPRITQCCAGLSGDTRCPADLTYARPALTAGERLDRRTHEHHAEQRALRWAFERGLRVETIIPTLQPCSRCRGAIATTYGDPTFEAMPPQAWWGAEWVEAAEGRPTPPPPDGARCLQALP
jgi:hypothetical protein